MKFVVALATGLLATAIVNCAPIQSNETTTIDIKASKDNPNIVVGPSSWVIGCGGWKGINCVPNVPIWWLLGFTDYFPPINHNHIAKSHNDTSIQGVNASSHFDPWCWLYSLVIPSFESCQIPIDEDTKSSKSLKKTGVSFLESNSSASNGTTRFSPLLNKISKIASPARNVTFSQKVDCGHDPRNPACSCEKDPYNEICMAGKPAWWMYNWILNQPTSGKKPPPNPNPVIGNNLKDKHPGIAKNKPSDSSEAATHEDAVVIGTSSESASGATDDSEAFPPGGGDMPDVDGKNPTAPQGIHIKTGEGRAGSAECPWAIWYLCQWGTIGNCEACLSGGTSPNFD